LAYGYTPLGKSRFVPSQAWVGKLASTTNTLEDNTITKSTFDTLKFVQHLRLAGVSEAQAKAEALTEALNETIAVRDLATKADLEHLKVDLIKWMAGLLFAQIAVIAALVKLL